MSHFYDENGKACHTQKTKSKTAKNPERGTTIKDAKKLKLVPSVTEIIKLMDKPNLTVWKVNEALKAYTEVIKGFSGTDIADITDDMFKVIQSDANTQMSNIGKIAAERGSHIHKMIEDLLNGTVSIDDIENPDDKNIAFVVRLKLKELGIVDTNSEITFTNKEGGYGGCVDLSGIDEKGNYFILDFKTKDTAEKEVKNESKAYYSTEYLMQLIAYRMGLKFPSNTRLINMVISRDEVWVEIKEWDDSLKYNAYMMFNALRDLWIAKNNYDPRI